MLTLILLGGCQTIDTLFEGPNVNLRSGTPHVATPAAIERLQNQACVYADNPNWQAIQQNGVLAWDPCFTHNSPTHLAIIAAGIHEFVAQVRTQVNPPVPVSRVKESRAHESEPSVKPVSSFSELDNQLYYLRAFSQYGDINRQPDSNLQTLTTAIGALINEVLLDSSGLPKTQLADLFDGNHDLAARLIEHVFVTSYQLFIHPSGQHVLPSTLKLLTALINKPNALGSSIQAQYTWLELYRTAGFLAYHARYIPLIKALLTAEKDLALPQFVTALVQYIKVANLADWQLQNALWALANVHYILSPVQQSLLDNLVIDALFQPPNRHLEQNKQMFSQVYLANSFRVMRHCQTEFKGLCDIPPVEQVLPIKHQCSDSLFIRGQNINQEQLDTACLILNNQTRYFHQTINSHYLPVKDDFNDALQVVIFENYSEYNRWGQLLFNIHTESGGMYIEGRPEQQGNQATFYAFQAFWQAPYFSVWNLRHEHVHYLDGRYVKYGGVAQFPSHITWWSEGLAEYIHVPKHNAGAFAILNRSSSSQWLTLYDIFNTSAHDNVEQTYQWSYLAVRFLFEQQKPLALQIIAQLRQGDFAQYLSLLTNISRSQQLAFAQWLAANSPPPLPEAPEITPYDLKHRIKYLPRYLYRDYLRPSHLPKTERHWFFSDWG